MKTTNHQMTIAKKNSKMKTIKLNKNGKAQQAQKTKTDKKADQIKDILAHVTSMSLYAEENRCTDHWWFEELEEMLWKLANGK